MPSWRPLYPAIHPLYELPSQENRTEGRANSDKILIPPTAFLIGPVGLLLSIVSNFCCGYVVHMVSFTEQIEDDGLSNRFVWHQGIWNYEAHDASYDDEKGKWHLNTYNFSCLPWNEQSGVDKDGIWRVTQFITILSATIGELVLISSCLIFLTSKSKTYTRVVMNVFGYMYILIAFFQILTFLYFDSVMANLNFCLVQVLLICQNLC